MITLPTDRAACPPPDAQSKLAHMIDQRRALAAQVAGLDVQINMALGDRDGARRALREMQALVEARRGVREACHFDEQGERDALALRGRVVNG